MANYGGDEAKSWLRPVPFLSPARLALLPATQTSPGDRADQREVGADEQERARLRRGHRRIVGARISDEGRRRRSVVASRAATTTERPDAARKGEDHPLPPWPPAPP